MNASAREKQKATLRRFIDIYCRHHCTSRQGDQLCAECQDLLDHASSRLDKCPFDPKPMCKDCAVHCYGPTYRDRIRKVMRFSGMHMVKRGRLDWLVRYFLAR